VSKKTDEEEQRLRDIINTLKGRLKLWEESRGVVFLDSGGKLVYLPFKQDNVATVVAENLCSTYPHHHVLLIGSKMEYQKVVQEATWTAGKGPKRFEVKVTET